MQCDKRIKLKTASSVIFIPTSLSHHNLKAVNRPAQILWTDIWINTECFKLILFLLKKVNMTLLLGSLKMRIKASAMNWFCWDIGVLHYWHTSYKFLSASGRTMITWQYQMKCNLLYNLLYRIFCWTWCLQWKLSKMHRLCWIQECC